MKIFTLIFLLQSLLVFYPQQAHAENDYPNCNTGYHKDDASKKCVMDDDVREVTTATAQCQKDYPNDEEKRRQCLLNNAHDTQQVKLSGSDYAEDVKATKNLEWSNRIIQPLWGALNIKFLSEKGKCQQNSAVAMSIAGLASATGEVWGFFRHKKKMKELIEAYKTRMKDASATTAQADAFRYLAEEQTVKADADHFREKVYWVATGIYAIAAILAVVEWTAEKTPPTYKPSACPNSGGTVRSIINNPAFKWFTTAAGLVPMFVGKPQTLEEKYNLNGSWDYENFEQMINGNLENAIAMEFQEREMDQYYFNEPSKRSELAEYDQRKQDWDNVTKISFTKILEQVKTQVLVEDAVAQDGITAVTNVTGGNGSNPNPVPSAVPSAVPSVAPSPVASNPKSPSQAAQDADASVTEEVAQNQAKNKGLDEAENKKANRTAALRFVASLAMGTLGGFTANHAGKIAELAEKRAGAYNDIADKLAVVGDDGAGICNTHDDPSQKECYCYNEDGAPNPARLKSEICKDLFKPKIVDKKPTDYNKPGAGPGTGCVAINGVFDQACKCRELKDKNGNNACMKTQDGLDVSGMIGPNSFSSASLRGANDLFSGNLSGGNMGSNFASGITSAMNNLKKKVNDDLKKSGQKPVDFKKSQDAFLRSNFHDLKLAVAPSTFEGNGANSGSTGLATVLSDKELEKLEKTAAANGIKESELTFKPLTAAAKAKEAAKFDLSGLEGPSGPEQLDMASGNVMAKNFDYKNNDISGNSTESLFKMISNRYIVTGLQRLFEEIPAEKPKAKK